MTKKEKVLIREAIDLIHIQDRYYDGMEILAKLVGIKSRHDSLINLKIADISKIPENQKFRYKR